MKKVTKKEVDKIGGFSKKEIRKAYYEKKLPQFLLKFQAECDDLEEINKLKDLLVELKAEGSELVEEITGIVGEEDMGLKEYQDAPLAKFMGEMVPEEREVYELWRKSCDNALTIVNGIIRKTREDLKRKAQLKKDDWLDMALEIATLMKWIDEDRVYKDQMYRKVLMDEKAKRNCSRLEAEEITKTSQEYRDYKTAILFKDNLTEFIMLCKKKGAMDW